MEHIVDYRKIQRAVLSALQGYDRPFLNLDNRQFICSLAIIGGICTDHRDVLGDIQEGYISFDFYEVFDELYNRNNGILD